MGCPSLADSAVRLVPMGQAQGLPNLGQPDSEDDDEQSDSATAPQVDVTRVELEWRRDQVFSKLIRNALPLGAQINAEHGTYEAAGGVEKNDDTGQETQVSKHHGSDEATGEEDTFDDTAQETETQVNKDRGSDEAAREDEEFDDTAREEFDYHSNMNGLKIVEAAGKEEAFDDATWEEDFDYYCDITGVKIDMKSEGRYHYG